MKIHVIILLILVCTFNLLKAQSSDYKQDTTRNISTSTLQFGLRYKSDNYYMGRADSAKAPYVIPSVSYYHKSGFFLSGYVSYLTVPEINRVDLITLATGYDYFGEKILTGISVNQYFYSDLSYTVAAEMSTYLSAYFGYDFKWFMLVADASLGMSSELDVFLGGEISRSFYLLNDRLRITPSFYTNWGTQHYYNDYYTERSITTGSSSSQNGGSGQGGQGSGTGGTGGTGNGSGSGTGGTGNGTGGTGGTTNTGGTTTTTTYTTTTITEVSTLESEKFQMLDYELGLQASYRVKQFRFITSGTFLFPVNPSTVVTDQGTYKEALNTGFLWSAGIKYTIK